jgi:hypothetical protein
MNTGKYMHTIKYYVLLLLWLEMAVSLPASNASMERGLTFDDLEPLRHVLHRLNIVEMPSLHALDPVVELKRMTGALLRSYGGTQTSRLKPSPHAFVEQVLCEGTFAPLKKYFRGVTIAQMGTCKEAWLFEAATHEDKIIMRLFVAKYGHLLHNDNVFAAPVPDATLSAVDERQDKGHADLSRSCLSAALKGTIKGSSLPFFGAVWFQKRLLDECAAFGNVESIDLLHNTLFDEDLAIIVDCVLNLMPNCKLINLSTTRVRSCF